MPGLKLHHREQVVAEATGEIARALWDIIEKYDLTYGETTRILAGELLNLAKYQIRQERHPDDPDKRGGEE